MVRMLCVNCGRVRHSSADFLCRYMQKWCKAWEEDLEKRPAAVKNSGPGDGACAAAVHV